MTPAGPVQASKDHSNSIHEANKEGVKAYAKIAALDWTYYITKLQVNIGRSSDPSQHRENAQDDPDAVHIDLGPSKLISRLHAVIYFNRDQEKWWLLVKGRNSLKVDGALWKVGQSGPLRSGEVIEIGGIEMMFVLPIELSPLQIAPQYLERAGIIKPDPAAPTRAGRHPLPSGDTACSSSPSKSTRGQSSQKPLAPAPPDYKRPGTPPSARGRGASTKTPHEQGSSNPVMMAHGDVDLSLDENRHIKPQYSYAQMITQAILNTPDQKLNLAGIYQYIQQKYAYYRHQPATGWQNSIRHNLSLNKAFEKIARSTDEPGKGMKWQLVPETRDEMVRSAWRGGRGGHRGSSNPSSPNQLSYITSGPKDMAARDPVSARKRKVSPSGSPQPRSSLRESSTITPVRPTRKPLPDEAGGQADSPLNPRAAGRKSTLTASNTINNNITNPAASATLGMVENANVTATPASPTLTSSYLQDNDGSSFVTPAPHRVHPKLAPPSTAQRPSQHMPTSSPAPFWKYADIGSTPLKPTQAMTPFESPSKIIAGNNAASGGGGASKVGGGESGTVVLPPPSSSPPPAAVGSPTRVASGTCRAAPAATVEDPTSPPVSALSAATALVGDEEEQGFDLTKYAPPFNSLHLLV